MQTTVWPQAPMLVSGYTLDPLGTAIDKLVLVLSMEGTIIWQHDLREPVAVIPVAPAEEEGAAKAQ